MSKWVSRLEVPRHNLVVMIIEDTAIAAPDGLSSRSEICVGCGGFYVISASDRSQLLAVV